MLRIIDKKSIINTKSTCDTNAYSGTNKLLEDSPPQLVDKFGYFGLKIQNQEQQNEKITLSAKRSKRIHLKRNKYSKSYSNIPQPFKDNRSKPPFKNPQILSRGLTSNFNSFKETKECKIKNSLPINKNLR